LPARLSYPEIIPARFHKDFLYEDQEELIEKLSSLLLNLPSYRQTSLELAGSMACFAWEKIISSYDEELEKLARMTRA